MRRLISSSASILGLNFSFGQLQLFTFRLVPQVGHKPLQSTVQSAFIGRHASNTCSCRMSPIASSDPLKNAVRVSFSVSSISSSSSNRNASRWRKKRSNDRSISCRAGSRQREQPSSTAVTSFPTIRISAPGPFRRCGPFQRLDLTDTFSRRNVPRRDGPNERHLIVCKIFEIDEMLRHGPTSRSTAGVVRQAAGTPIRFNA